LARNKTDCLLLTKNKHDYIGIITNNDIQKRILTLKLNTDNPVYLIMSAPIVTVNESTSIYDALNICEEKNINHLVVKNEIDEITGILKLSDIHKILKNSLSFYVDNVRKSETTDELKQAYKSLQLLIKPLIYSGLSVDYITHITSSFSDAIIKKINYEPGFEHSSEKAKEEMAGFFIAQNKENSIDYTSKYVVTVESEDKNKCPKCGAPLVLRTAKKGANAGNEFWGCSRFPKCRG